MTGVMVRRPLEAFQGLKPVAGCCSEKLSFFPAVWDWLFHSGFHLLQTDLLLSDQNQGKAKRCPLPIVYWVAPLLKSWMTDKGSIPLRARNLDYRSFFALSKSKLDQSSWTVGFKQKNPFFFKKGKGVLLVWKLLRQSLLIWIKFSRLLSLMSFLYLLPQL